VTEVRRRMGEGQDLRRIEDSLDHCENNRRKSDD
jgi:hypothetical protein